MKQPKHVYMIGGGIGTLSAAAFLIRDGGVAGDQITIFESLPNLGGALDAEGTPERGYSLPGGRMFTLDNYECTWELLKDIPSLDTPGMSVYEEVVDFNKKHKSHARARLVDALRHKESPEAMGFDMQDRKEMLRLIDTDEEELGRDPITDWFSPHFFTTNFWYMWATTFAFQPWHSAVEFKRYMLRFMLEYTRIETLEGVRRTKYNQYDSIVRPLAKWLGERGVIFKHGHLVTDVETAEVDGKIAVAQLTIAHGGREDRVPIGTNDLVFLQNGSMTDAYTLGSMTSAPEKTGQADAHSFALWEKIAKKHEGFGDPAVFNSSVPESYWESFTVTLKDPTFFRKMQEWTGNEAGTGGLVTFKDSSWFMSVVLAHQPHYADQPDDVQVFWGYALHPDRIGNFIAKPMSDCTGEEILRELCGHLNFDFGDVFGAGKAICVPCRMPFITSMFMPRRSTDRPLPVPKNSLNLAFVSQFVEVPEDCVFTVEFSVRAAQIAVYELLDIRKKVPPIKEHSKDLRVKVASAIKSFK